MSIKLITQLGLISALSLSSICFAQEYRLPYKYSDRTETKIDRETEHLKLVPMLLTFPCTRESVGVATSRGGGYIDLRAMGYIMLPGALIIDAILFSAGAVAAPIYTPYSLIKLGVLKHKLKEEILSAQKELSEIDSRMWSNLSKRLEALEDKKEYTLEQIFSMVFLATAMDSLTLTDGNLILADGRELTEKEVIDTIKMLESLKEKAPFRPFDVTFLFEYVVRARDHIRAANLPIENARIAVINCLLAKEETSNTHIKKAASSLKEASRYLFNIASSAHKNLKVE